VDCRIDHILDLLGPLHFAGFLRIGAVFGPQHRLFGHTQDNMIEWEGSADAARGWPVYSLYGARREPSDEMLAGLDLLLIDLPDVGARYYTFIWTMALCLKACARLGLPVCVLDRPNPIGGEAVEGPVLTPEFSSFVGLHPLPTRHGMTIGEIARCLRSEFYPACEVAVMEMERWDRSMYFEDTGLPWVMPSPNMPTPESAVVYPGGCLLEATNLSEGRGTTRPFEIVGAPFLDASEFCGVLRDLGLRGVKFRPIEFEPTFNKHAGKVCGGCFVHVRDRHIFEPVLTYVAILQTAIGQARSEFEWKEPPYEYEFEKRPIDILAGNSWLAPAIEDEMPLDEVRQRFRAEARCFGQVRSRYLAY